MDIETAEMLATKFSKVLNEWLTAEQMDEVRQRNAGGDPLCCATHDFCDANQAMLDALDEAGIEWGGPEDDEGNRLISKAWDLAKSRGFRVDEA